MGEIIKVLKRSETDKQIVCFPFVGGTWLAFKEVAESINVDAEIITVNPPGHMMDKQPLLDNVDTMADYYMSELKYVLKDNVIFWGYSLGGLVSYSILKNTAYNQFNPKAFIISASMPPHLAEYEKKLTNDEAFINWIKSLGGTSNSLLDDASVLNYFLPILKADYKAFEEYRPEIVKLNIPGYLISGTDDNFSTTAKMEEWEKYFLKSPDIYNIKGGHFYIKENPVELSNIIDNICTQAFSND